MSVLKREADKAVVTDTAEAQVTGCLLDLLAGR